MINIHGNGIPMDKAELLSTLLEGILYGFSLLMFGGTMWALLYRGYFNQVNRKMLIAACLLLLFSTVHLIIDIIRIMDGLILYRDTYTGGPAAFFSDMSHWTFVTKNYFYVVQSLIGDGVILYRCYMVWQSKLVMLFPVLLWCAVGISGFGAASEATHQSNFSSFSEWVRAFYTMTFSTNLLATLLLAYRIWYLDRKAARIRGHSKSPLRKILHIIVDAGVLYNATILVAWILFSIDSNGQFVTLNMIMPIISISFYMVIIRVGLLPLEHASNFRGESIKRMQVHITTLTEHEIENRPCSSAEQ